MSTSRVAYGSNESARAGSTDSPAAPMFSAPPAPSGRGCTSPSSASPISGTCRKLRLTRNARVRHASIIQSATTTPALNWKAASDHAWTVPKASVVVTTARHSSRMMKRLQTVRGASATALAALGGAAGGAGGGVSSSADGDTSTCDPLPADALEIEVVIPDFTEDGARAVGARRAAQTNHHGLRALRRRELGRALLPLRARLGGERRGSAERGPARAVEHFDDGRARALQILRARDEAQAVARLRLDRDQLQDALEVHVRRHVEGEAQRARAAVLHARIDGDLHALRRHDLPAEILLARGRDVRLEAAVADRFS